MSPKSHKYAAGSNDVLTLNLTPDTDGEYVACPDTITLNHLTEGVVDPVAGQAAGLSYGSPRDAMNSFIAFM